MNWFKLLFQRLGSETPAFFKKALAASLLIAASGGILAIIPEKFMPHFLLDLVVKYEVDKWLTLIGLISAFWSKVPTTDPVLSKKA